MPKHHSVERIYDVLDNHHNFGSGKQHIPSSREKKSKVSIQPLCDLYSAGPGPLVQVQLLDYLMTQFSSLDVFRCNPLSQRKKKTQLAPIVAASSVQCCLQAIRGVLHYFGGLQASRRVCKFSRPQTSTELTCKQDSCSDARKHASGQDDIFLQDRGRFHYSTIWKRSCRQNNHM